MPFAGGVAPAGWLKANGVAVSRSTYSDLFGVIGTTYGVGDGSTTFGLPDLRAEFIRGFDDGRGVDSGRLLGSWQADALKAHTHDLPIEYGGNQNLNSLIDTSNMDEKISEIAKTGSTGGAETRPRNIAMLYCIKH